MCDGQDCHVATTPKVEHYLPDAVVSVFRQTKSNPWDYANTVFDVPAQAAGDAQIKSTLGFHLGYGNQSESASEEQNNHFKEADVIGNPAITLGFYGIIIKAVSQVLGSISAARISKSTDLKEEVLCCESCFLGGRKKI